MAFAYHPDLPTRRTISFVSMAIAATVAASFFDAASILGTTEDLAMGAAVAGPSRTISNSSTQRVTEAEKYQQWLGDAHARCARTGGESLAVDAF